MVEVGESCAPAALSFREASLAERFRRDGFVVVPAMTAHEASDLRRNILKSLPDGISSNDPQGALYGTLFDEQLRTDGAAIADGVIGSFLDRLLTGHRYEGGYVVAKPASSGRLDLHQHQPVTEYIFDIAVHCWVTLDDVDEERGALRVVPGSHSILRHVQSFQTPGYFAGFAERLEQDHAMTLSMTAGEAVIFERSLLHGSAPNRGDGPSLRLLGTAIPASRQLCVLSEPAPGTFEALRVEGNIDPTLYCITDGNAAALSNLGVVANRNLAIDEDEFVALVRGGAKIRPGFDPIDAIRSRTPAGFAKQWLRRLASAGAT